MAVRVFGPGTKAGRGAGIATATIGAYRVVGFISATQSFALPVLAAQRTDIDAAASVAGLPVQAYLIEMSRPRPGDLWTPAVRDLLRSARAGGLEAVVLEHVDRLADERDAALLAAVMLAECGVRVIESRGELLASREPVAARTRAVRGAKSGAFDLSVRS